MTEISVLGVILGLKIPACRTYISSTISPSVTYNSLNPNLQNVYNYVTSILSNYLLPQLKLPILFRAARSRLKSPSAPACRVMTTLKHKLCATLPASQDMHMRWQGRESVISQPRLPSSAHYLQTTRLCKPYANQPFSGPLPPSHHPSS